MSPTIVICGRCGEEMGSWEEPLDYIRRVDDLCQPCEREEGEFEAEREYHENALRDLDGGW